MPPRNPGRVEIVVPSAYRPNALLTTKFIPWATVVVPFDQYDAYVAGNPGVNVVPLPRHHPAGIGASRDWIIRTGTVDRFMLDDDIAGCYVMNRPGRVGKPITGEQFQAAVDAVCDVAADLGLYMFGLGQSLNPMHFDVQHPFKMTGNCVGGCMGVRAGSKLYVPPECHLVAEDTWLCLLNAHLYRAMVCDLRYKTNGLSMVNPGGCAGHRTPDREREATAFLVRSFGDAVKVIDSPKAQRPGSCQPIIPF